MLNKVLADIFTHAYFSIFFNFPFPSEEQDILNLTNIVLKNIICHSGDYFRGICIN